MTKIIDRRNKSMGGSSKRALSRIKNIAVHYSATASGNTAVFERYWSGTHKWNTGGYHEVILLNGDVELNYDADVISNGVGGLNTSMYNICYVGDGNPNAKQLATLKERVNYNRKRLGVPVANVKGHREFSGQSTSCPRLDMSEFRKSLDVKTVKPPKKQTGFASKRPATAYTGNSIVDYLKSIKVDSSIGNRRKLAAQYGIKGFTGTAAQNTALLNAMRKGVAPKKDTVKPTPKSSKSITQMANEILKGKHGNGHAKRRKSLGISKAEYEKVRTEVNRRLK